jgi:hypothetical protein
MEMESILRGSFVSLTSKGYPNRCHNPNRDREKRNTHTNAWPGFPERSTRARLTGLGSI